MHYRDEKEFPSPQQFVQMQFTGENDEDKVVIFPSIYLSIYLTIYLSICLYIYFLLSSEQMQFTGENDEVKEGSLSI